MAQQQQLMQNCDLPPPTKLFLLDNPIHHPNPNNNKIILEMALKLSQARATEAERRMEEAMKDRAFAINALVSESMRVMAYRRWLMMLELKLKNAVVDTGRSLRRDVAEKDDDDDGGFHKWDQMGLLICLGLAGLGFAYRLRFLFK